MQLESLTLNPRRAALCYHVRHIQQCCCPLPCDSSADYCALNVLAWVDEEQYCTPGGVHQAHVLRCAQGLLGSCRCMHSEARILSCRQLHTNMHHVLGGAPSFFL